MNGQSVMCLFLFISLFCILFEMLLYVLVKFLIFIPIAYLISFEINGSCIIIYLSHIDNLYFSLSSLFIKIEI